MKQKTIIQHLLPNLRYCNHIKMKRKSEETERGTEGEDGQGERAREPEQATDSERAREREGRGGERARLSGRAGKGKGERKRETVT